MQVAVYAGVPAAVAALRVAADVLRDEYRLPTYLASADHAIRWSVDAR